MRFLRTSFLAFIIKGAMIIGLCTASVASQSVNNFIPMIKTMYQTQRNNSAITDVYAELQLPTSDVQKIRLIVPQNPKAKVILFSGGPGVLNLAYENGKHIIACNEDTKNNFLVRKREAFANRGFIVALIDCPESLKAGNGFRTRPMRITNENHKNGVAATIYFLKNMDCVGCKTYILPIWLVGTSNGTYSVAHFGAVFKEDVDGLILTSSILDTTETKDNEYEKGILDLNLSGIDDPVYIAHHKNDKCRLCPESELFKLMVKLENSPKIAISKYCGGITSDNSCKGLSHHGFYGIEDEVIHDITCFIESVILAVQSSSETTMMLTPTPSK